MNGPQLMKYRHAHHAGNFADVHKHATLLALLAALQRKEKGFLYLETHAGRGRYRLAEEAHLGVGRFLKGRHTSPELQHYASAVASFGSAAHDGQTYPGSPLLAAGALRAQDRAIFVEIDPAESRALELASGHFAQARVECGDGYARLRAHLPPGERRGLTFIDPPYEETRQDFARVETAIAEAARRFATGVLAAWYPVKSQRDIDSWHRQLVAKFSAPLLVSELWLYPRDSRVALNGSGLLIVNPPYQAAERMESWLPELHALLDVDGSGGSRSFLLNADRGDQV